tara:strand:+ start:235 stop:375 length:141 start_codon:yes stop_codon:yes gene_type:complete
VLNYTPDEFAKINFHKALKYLAYKIEKEDLEADLRNKSNGKNVTKL